MMGTEPLVLVFHMQPKDLLVVAKFKLPFDRLRVCVSPLVYTGTESDVTPELIEPVAKMIDVLIVSNSIFERYGQDFLAVDGHTIIGVVVQPYAALHCYEGKPLHMDNVRFIAARRSSLVHGAVFRQAPSLEHLFLSAGSYGFSYGVYEGIPRHWFREAFAIEPQLNVAKHVHSTQEWESCIHYYCKRILSMLE